MKTYTINQTELEAKIIELMKATQDVDTLQGAKKWLCWNAEMGLYITDWVLGSISIQDTETLISEESWSTEEAYGSDAMQEYYDDPDFSTKEEALEAAREEYYEWEAYSDQMMDTILYDIEQLNELGKIELKII